MAAVWLITIPWLLALTGIFFLSKRYRSLSAFSQPEMVGKRFGDTARRALAIPIALVFLVWGGAEIYVAATVLAPGLHLQTSITIVGVSVVVAIYAIMGGFRAVVFYFLESGGCMSAVEPEWLLETGLGYVFWGVMSSVTGYGVGYWLDRRKTLDNGGRGQ